MEVCIFYLVSVRVVVLYVVYLWLGLGEFRVRGRFRFGENLGKV